MTNSPQEQTVQERVSGTIEHERPAGSMNRAEMRKAVRNANRKEGRFTTPKFRFNAGRRAMVKASRRRNRAA
jgi:hypothetical protein